MWTFNIYFTIVIMIWLISLSKWPQIPPNELEMTLVNSRTSERISKSQTSSWVIEFIPGIHFWHFVTLNIADMNVFTNKHVHTCIFVRNSCDLFNASFPHSEIKYLIHQFIQKRRFEFSDFGGPERTRANNSDSKVDGLTKNVLC